jgi:IS30 family transposase
MHNQSEILRRRERVATLYARSMTEIEIARELHVDQATISRDLKAIKDQVSQQFVYDLARSDLAYYYKNCLDTIEETRKEA